MSQAGPDDLIGRDVGRFRVLSRLGMGGMGIVYVAEDRELRRRVALKVLRHDARDDETRVHRFLREARAAAAISHAAVATIYEAGETSEGLVFLAMELVDGVSLRAYIARQRLTIAEIVRIATSIGEALEAAHAAGVVHRDLKPDNVMIGREGHVKVLDFGLAKLKPSAAPASGQGATSFATIAGDVVGTPEYMAPEQAMGRTLDGRADLFSLGATMFEMLSGARPYARPTPVAVLAALLTEDAPDVRPLRPDAPAWLCALVDALLAKEPADRPASARAVVEALRAQERSRVIPPTAEFVAGASPASASHPALANTLVSPSPGPPAHVASAPTPAPTPAPMAAPPRRSWWIAALALVSLLGLVGIVVVVLVVAFAYETTQDPEVATEAPPTTVAPAAIATPTLAPRTLVPASAAMHFVLAALAPDGDQVAFVTTGGELSVVSTEGGAVGSVPLAGVTAIDALVYAPSGALTALVHRHTWDVVRIDTVTGALETLRPSAGRGQLSPDARRLLVVAADHSLHVHDLETGDDHALGLTAPIAAARWSSDAASILVRGPEHHPEQLIRVDLAGHTSVLLEEPRLDLESIAASVVDGGGQVLATLADLPPLAPGVSLALVPRAGGEPRQLASFDGRTMEPLAISSDGRRLIARVTAIATEIRVARLDADHHIGDFVSLTTTDRQDRQPTFLDANTIGLARAMPTGSSLMQIAITGGPASPLVTTEASLTSPQREHLGSILAFETDVSAGPTASRLVRIDDAGHVVPFGGDTTTSFHAIGRPSPRRQALSCAVNHCVMATSNATTVVLAEIDGQVIATLPGDAPFLFVAIDQVDATLVVVSTGALLRVVEVATGHVLWEHATTGVQSIAWVPNTYDLYATYARGDDHGLLHIDEEGHEETLMQSTRTFFAEVAVAPDGAHLALVAKPEREELVVLDLP